MALIEDYLIFVDTETTGLNPGVDQCVEIAAILATLDGREVARFDQRIQLPRGFAVSAEVAAINGYDAALWEETAVPFSEFVEFMRHVPYGHVAVPVGHNVGFDRRMIHESHYGKRFCPLSYHIVDTVSLAGAMRFAGALQCDSLKLDSVCAALGIPREKHRAMIDCEAARAVFLRHAEMLRVGAALEVSSHG